MGLYSVEAIVLRTRDLGEADKVITLYSESEGRLGAVARGARRPRNRLLGVTQVFTHGRFYLFPGKNLDSLSQGEIRNSFLSLREDLTKMAYASYFAEIVDAGSEEREKNRDLFYLVLTAMWLLQESPQDPGTVARWFELKLASATGYKIELHRCLVCSKEVPGPWFFSPEQGGTICSACSRAVHDIRALSEGALATLRQLERMEPRKMHTLRLFRDVAAELELLLGEYTERCVGRPLRSKGFLKEISTMGFRPEEVDSHAGDG